MLVRFYHLAFIINMVAIHPEIREKSGKSQGKMKLFCKSLRKC